MEMELNEMYNVSSLLPQIRVSADKHREEQDKECEATPKLIKSPCTNNDIAAKYQISPRPYVIDKKQESYYK